MFQFALKYLLPAVVVGLLALTVYHVQETKPKDETGKPPLIPPKTEFNHTVAGTGIIEARTENVDVGTTVPGVVTEVYIEVGQEVRTGDKLFKIDDRELRAELLVREKAVVQAESDWQRLQRLPRREQLAVTQAAINEARANLANKLDEYQRAQELVKSRTWTEQDLINREQAYKVARAQLEKVEAELLRLQQDLIAWDYEINAARSAVELAQSKTQQVQTQIERTTVTVREIRRGGRPAPAAYRVLQVNIRPGEFAATPASKPLILLGDIEQLHVRADIDEHDIPRVPRFTVGATDNPQAFARIKGVSTERIPLTFVREEPYVVPKKSLTGLNTERVDTRVLQLIFSIEARDRRLFVGQQVDIFIDAATTAKEAKSQDEPTKLSGKTAAPAVSDTPQ